MKVIDHYQRRKDTEGGPGVPTLCGRRVDVSGGYIEHADDFCDTCLHIDDMHHLGMWGDPHGVVTEVIT